MLQTLKNRNFLIMLAGDAFLMGVSYLLAYYLRFDWHVSLDELTNFWSTVVWIVPIKLACFFYFGLYKGMWRYSGIEDLKNLSKGCVVSSAIIVLVLLVTVRFVGFPRSIFPIDLALTFITTGALRIGIRLYYNRDAAKSRALFSNGKNEDKDRRVLIVGAGDAGEKTLREILDNPRLSYRVVGFLDDDPRKRGRALHNVPVLGETGAIPIMVKDLNVEEVIIAVPSATGEQIRKVVEACDVCSVPCKTLPGIGELIDGKVSIKALRDVDYHDLLGRAKVELDMEAIGGYLTNKVVLVTGAGGSIGSELCRQIVRFSPETLVLFDTSEPLLYAIQMELKHRVGYLKYRTVLGNVQDHRLTDAVFRAFKPHVVFHAAAYKHVPMLERNPWESVFNNIVGSKTIIEKAIEHEAERVVLVSTDKAVRPTNVMGASKRVAEMVLQSCQGNGTRLMAVRFGNVVGSSGSVIPLFRNQIEMGGPVTITHPEVTRYFMTIPEAAQLILEAGALGTGDEIFILEMGTPVKIAEMARDLIRLSGKEPDRDIEIAFTGLRPGEKLYEELITEDEGVVETEHEKIMVLRNNQMWNGYGDQEGYRRWLNEGIEELVALAEKHDGCGIREKLKEMIPEYSAQDSECVI